MDIRGTEIYAKIEQLESRVAELEAKNLKYYRMAYEQGRFDVAMDRELNKPSSSGCLPSCDTCGWNGNRCTNRAKPSINYCTRWAKKPIAHETVAEQIEKTSPEVFSSPLTSTKKPSSSGCEHDGGLDKEYPIEDRCDNCCNLIGKCTCTNPTPSAECKDPCHPFDCKCISARENDPRKPSPVAECEHEFEYSKYSENLNRLQCKKCGAITFSCDPANPSPVENNLEDRIFKLIYEGVHDGTACNIRAIAKGIVKDLTK